LLARERDAFSHRQGGGFISSLEGLNGRRIAIFGNSGSG
jgi:hypothetical protein